MSRVKTIRTAAENTEIDCRIDRILASEDELIPSSGFLASVMERVQQENAQPAPLPFPWKRLLPGALMVSGVLSWGGYELIRQGLSLSSLFASKTTVLLPMRLPDAAAAFANQAEWVALALGASLLCWLFARRLAGRGGLF